MLGRYMNMNMNYVLGLLVIRWLIFLVNSGNMSLELFACLQFSPCVLGQE